MSRLRVGLRSRVCLAVAAGALAGSSPAVASTVTVRLDREFNSFNEVFYAAAPGERNEVTVAYAADALSVTVTDPGAVVQPQGSCTPVDQHSATCRAPTPEFPIAGPFVQKARVELGDLDDSVVTTRPGPNVIGGVDADGGPGNDRLIGSPAEDALDGGGGRDELRGGAGFDTLSDGDSDGAPGDQAPGSDILDGGPGRDTLSYRQRIRAVTVDLGGARANGAPGERDAVSSIESATGGEGDDHLFGDRRANVLDGGGGENELIGRAGDDTLRRPSSRSASCGAGRDVVISPRAATSIPAACERLLFRLPRSTLSDDDFFDIAPVPERRVGRRGFEVRCPQIDGEPLRCSAELRIRARSSRRLIASGSVSAARRERRFLRLSFTAYGRRLLRDPHRVVARTTLRGKLLPNARWTTRF